MQMQMVSRPAVWLPAVSLCRRELVRFVRQPNRVIGALATPLVFWLLIGGGMGSSFQIKEMAGGHNYIQYFFPGTIVMILLFTAIFSTISIIEDRREGFLQSVLVAPVSRMAIVLGKVLGGTILAFVQGAIFLALAPTVGIHLRVVSVVLTLAMMFILSFALTGLGFCIAWRMSSTQGFHAIMNLFLLPLWFLSGALFPMDKAWGVLRWVMMLNPVTYGLSAIRRSLYWGQPMGNHLPSMSLSVIVSVVFALAMFLSSSAIAAGRVSADLQ